MKTNKRRSRKQILAHLEAQRKSGLSVIKYCAEHNITKQTFYGWRKRYEVPIKSSKSKNDFISLKIEPSITKSNNIIAQINHPNGYSISFYRGCTPLFLAQTIKQL
jgi:transposase-like protein